MIKSFNKQHILVLVAISLIVFGLDLVTGTSMGPDSTKYKLMSSLNLGDFEVGPFCWRVLRPFIISIMPFSLEFNALIVTYISLIATLFYLYLILLELKFQNYAIVCSLLFVLMLPETLRLSLEQVWLIDSTSSAILTMFIFYSLKRNCVISTILLIMGVLCKESIFLFAPFYYLVKNSFKFNQQEFIHFIIMVCITTGVLLLVRSLIRPINADVLRMSEFQNLYKDVIICKVDLVDIRNPLTLIQRVYEVRKTETIPTAYGNDWLKYFYSLFAGFGLVSTYFICCGIFQGNPRLRAVAVLLVVNLIVVFLFAIDTSRLIASGFPVAILFFAEGLKSASHQICESKKIAKMIHFCALLCFICVSTAIFLKFLSFVSRGRMVFEVVFLVVVLIIILISKRNGAKGGLNSFVTNSFEAV